MTDNSFLLEVQGEIATIILNRPEKRNAITPPMYEALPELLEQVEANPKVKLVIIRGAGDKAFSAGADIDQFEAVYATPESAQIQHDRQMRAHGILASLAKPTIALIQGYCVGGGCSIALSCDFRYADSASRLGITPAKLGLAYSLADTKLLVDLVGPAKAKEMLFSGRLVDAAEALRIGLVDHVCAPDDIVAETLAFANLIGQSSQYSVRATKKIVTAILDGAVEDTKETSRLARDAIGGEDYLEGVRAFLEKRKPKFTYS